jgi:hypothetical protein
MADNVTIPATGTGTATPIIATDDVGGVQYQRMKLSLGPDGTATDVKTAADLQSTVPETGLLAAGWGPGWHRAIADVNATGPTDATIYTGGCATVVIDISGTFTGLSGSVQGSMDNAVTYADLHTFQSYELLNSRGEVAQSGIGTARRYLISPAGYTHIRYHVTAVSTGTAVIKIVAQPVPYALVPSNQQFTLLSSAARTTTTASSDVSNYHNRGAYIFVNVTSITSTPIIAVQVQGKEPVGSNYFNICEFAAITATGTAAFLTYPGQTKIPGVVESFPLPRSWRINVVHQDADSITYSVSCMGLL